MLEALEKLHDNVRAQDVDGIVRSACRLTKEYVMVKGLQYMEDEDLDDMLIIARDKLIKKQDIMDVEALLRGIESAGVPD